MNDKFYDCEPTPYLLFLIDCVRRGISVSPHEQVWVVKKQPTFVDRKDWNDTAWMFETLQEANAAIKRYFETGVMNNET